MPVSMPPDYDGLKVQQDLTRKANLERRGISGTSSFRSSRIDNPIVYNIMTVGDEGVRTPRDDNGYSLGGVVLNSLWVNETPMSKIGSMPKVFNTGQFGGEDIENPIAYVISGPTGDNRRTVESETLKYFEVVDKNRTLGQIAQSVRKAQLLKEGYVRVDVQEEVTDVSCPEGYLQRSAEPSEGSI